MRLTKKTLFIQPLKKGTTYFLFLGRSHKNKRHEPELPNIVHEGYDTPQLNDHKQSCGSASVKDKHACIMPSDSKFAAGKAESPPMHNGEFDTSPTKYHAIMHR